MLSIAIVHDLSYAEVFSGEDCVSPFSIVSNLLISVSKKGLYPEFVLLTNIGVKFSIKEKRIQFSDINLETGEFVHFCHLVLGLLSCRQNLLFRPRKRKFGPNLFLE